MSVLSFLYISSALFCIGLYLIITRKNVVAAFMGIELMLNASNLNLISFSNKLDGQVFAILVIVIAASEIAIALALILNIHRKFYTLDLDELIMLKK